MKQNNNDKKWQGSISLLCLLIAVIVCVTKVKYCTEILFFVVCLQFITTVIIQHLYKEKSIKVEKIAIEKDNNNLNLKLPSQFSLPYAVIDTQKKLLFYNTMFEQIFGEKALKTNQKVFRKLFPHYDVKEQKQTISFKERTFDIYTSFCETKNNTVDTALLCFVETTQYQNLEATLQEQKTVVSLLFLDNYEEVIETLDESRLPILTALIDRKLNNFASSVEGIVKKFEKDRYIFVFSQKQLEILKEKKFELLNQIREITVGEHIPVTISMGIGVDDKNLEAAMKSAKAAVALALGRGGDQVLIKEGEKYLFYGGKSGEISHNARIRARVKADALWEMIGETNDVFVMGHKKADLDSIGACMGIYTIAQTMEKQCYIVLDQVSPGIKRLYERLEETEEYKTVFITQQQALEKANEQSLVVVVDTHRPIMTICPQLLDISKKIVVFDHHRKSTDFIDNAVLIYHEPYASSTCELITEMIQYFGEKIKLKPLQADALLAGITVDTKNFCAKTGAITFEAAAFLRRHGADSTRVRLLFQNDMASYQAKASAVKDAKMIYKDIAFSVCPSDVENSVLTTAMAADDLLNIVGVKASFVCCFLEEVVYISARSFGEINVQMIMEKLGGGGHMTISGAQLSHCTIEQAEQKLKEAIESYLKEDT
ncbi:MAG: phosphoesterase [Firmicutes bacterium]|nr:phosphoesterase [Bacillota bacterium]